MAKHFCAAMSAAFAVMLMVAALTAAPGQVDEPPKKKWTLRWEAISASAMTQLISRETGRSLQISGRLYLHEYENVMGVDRAVVITALEGPDGKPLKLPDSSKRQRDFDTDFRLHSQVLNQGDTAADPVVHLAARLPIEKTTPGSFKRIAGHVEILSSSGLREQDVALEAGDWIEVGRRLSVRIVEAEMKPNSFRLKMELKAAAPEQFSKFHAAQHPEGGVFPRITRMALVNGEGTAIHGPDLSAVFHGKRNENGDVEGYVNMTSSFTRPRAYQSVRVTVVDSLEVQKIPFELHDVPVPTIRP